MQQANRVLLLAAFLSAGPISACDPEPEAGSSPEAAGDDVEVTLKRQSNRILVIIDDVSAAMADRSEPPRPERIVALRSSIEALREIVARSVDAKPPPSLGTATGQQVPGPSGAVRPSREPPDADELAALERAVEQTHLPGPPLREEGTEQTAAPLVARVEEACSDALGWLDEVESALESEQVDAARVEQSLGRAREIIENLAASL